MRSFLLATVLGGLHFGGHMSFDSKFMKPHDPVMDEVANILSGILSNLTKHKGYLQVGQDMQKRVKALGAKDHARLVGLLSEQISKLSSGKESFALDAFMSEHPTVPDARTNFQASLVSVVGELTKTDPGAPSLRTLLGDLKVEAAGKAVLFVDDSEACGKYSAVAEAVGKTHGIIVVNAANVSAPGVVDRVPEMYYVPADAAALPRRFEGSFDEPTVAKFVADHSAGTPDARKVLVRTAATHTVTQGEPKAPKRVQGVTAIAESQLTAMMSKPGEDTFIVFFAPWCGHCKNFVVADQSPLNQLNTEIQSTGAAGKLDVLKMDVSSQPTLPPAFGAVQFIPAIFFVPADRSRAIAHSGAQDVPAMLAFIDSHAQSAKGLLQ